MKISIFRKCSKISASKNRVSFERLIFAQVRYSTLKAARSRSSANVNKLVFCPLLLLERKIYWISRSFLRCYVEGKKRARFSKTVKNRVFESCSNIFFPLAYNHINDISFWMPKYFMKIASKIGAYLSSFALFFLQFLGHFLALFGPLYNDLFEHFIGNVQAFGKI